MDLSGQVKPDPRRRLPSIDRLCAEVGAACPEIPEWAIVAAARSLVEEKRAQLDAMISRGASAADLELILTTSWSVATAARASRLAAHHPIRVINATGVVLHTNLGRAPLSAGASQAAADAASCYVDLELDLETGERGDRLSSLSRKLEVLSGAESALAVNNNAAAVLLALNTLAAGREVVVSRGELVEIGGSFRVPAIMERAGVRLVEVGTTNRTHPHDYRDAIGPDTGLLLKVHRSNFEQRGFVKEVELPELVEIGREFDLPVIEDLGAGSLLDLSPHGFPVESDARTRLRTGVDLVCFSGDKLFGGPQAGIVLGREEIVTAMKRNPLARALRLDKMTLAALDWTVDALLSGRAEREVPVLARMLEEPAMLEKRGTDLLTRLSSIRDPRVELTLEVDRVPVGGGSLPGFELETRAIVLRSGPDGPSPGRIAEALRTAPVPVLARVRADSVSLDLRTIYVGEFEDVAAALEWVLR